MPSPFPWWYPVGAQLHEDGVAFRVWAEGHEAVSVRVKDREHELSADVDGFFSGIVAGAREGDTYSFLLDGKGPYPDPASRFQPEGPHGPSQIVNPNHFSWNDKEWPGLRLAHQVVYEMHIGTFTRGGTWRAATGELAHLAELGITAVELMPVCDFAGTFGWGYDGVDYFAPTRNYGMADDFRAFVNEAHARGIGVLLDVVYNNAGPDGNYLPTFSERYFSKERQTEWGAAINFDGEKNGPVREFFACNAAYWIKEFHLDGLRLDATHSISDSSKMHILEEITEKARRAAEPRSIIVVAENETQDTKLVRTKAAGGYALDAIWNEDFHHTAMVAATGSREAYFGDYLGSSQELLSCMKHGFLYQGQWYSWQKKRRGGSTLGINPAAMVTFLQNHDQVANSARGLRIHELTSFGRYKALTAVCLLAPGTPMLFQGQEFASSAPFLFFADHEAKLAELVRKGRADFMKQWRSLATDGIHYDDPCARATFEKCKLDFSEREKHGKIYALHGNLLKLRKNEPLFSRQTRELDGAVLSPEAFVVRFFSPDYPDDRLLVVNLGVQLCLNPAPVPLLAPPENEAWETLWSTEDVKYGGNGTAALDTEDQNWIVPAQAAVVLRPVKKEKGPAAS
ncbi:MAG: malto-oligosyltrehalose trehalohydrolase [Candidatus Acidiferrum sp.]